MASIAKLSILGCSSIKSAPQSANSSLANSKQVVAINNSNGFGGTLAENQTQDQLKNLQDIDNIQIEGSSEMNNDIKNKMLENTQFCVILQRPLENNNNNNNGQMKISLSPELAQKVAKEKGSNTLNSEKSPFFAGQFSVQTVNTEQQPNDNITTNTNTNSSTSQLLTEQLNATNHKQLKAIRDNSKVNSQSDLAIHLENKVNSQSGLNNHLENNVNSQSDLAIHLENKVNSQSGLNNHLENNVNSQSNLANHLENKVNSQSGLNNHLENNINYRSDLNNHLNSDIKGNINSFKTSQTINNSNFDSYETLLPKTSLNNQKFTHNIKSELSQNIGLSAKLTNNNRTNNNRTNINSKETSQEMNQSKDSYSSNHFQQQLNNLTVNSTNNSSAAVNSSTSLLQTEVDNIVNHIYNTKLRSNNLQPANSLTNNITNNIKVEFNSPLLGNVKLNLVENNNVLQITLVVNNTNSANQLNTNRKHIINSLKEKGFTDIEVNIKDLSKQNTINNKLKENIKN